MFLERRTSVRIACDLPSSFRDVENGTGDKTSRFALIKDISRGGVRLRVHHFIPLADRLIISLGLPKQRAIEVSVHPQWISEIPSLGFFDVGAKFIDLTEDAKIAIHNFQLQALSS